MPATFLDFGFGLKFSIHGHHRHAVAEEWAAIAVESRQQQFAGLAVDPEVHGLQQRQISGDVLESRNVAQWIPDLHETSQASIDLLIHRWVVVGVVPI